MISLFPPCNYTSTTLKRQEYPGDLMMLFSNYSGLLAACGGLLILVVARFAATAAKRATTQKMGANCRRQSPCRSPDRRQESLGGSHTMRQHRWRPGLMPEG